MKRLPAALLAAWLAGPCAVALAQGTDAEAQKRNIDNTEALIEKSSAAQRIRDSGNPAAEAERQRARELFAKAREAALNNDPARAGELLVEAKQTLFAAVRMAGAGAVAVDKHKNDYVAREASVRALLDAQTRVVGETSAKTEERGVEAEVRSLLTQAAAQAEKGDYVAGLASLDAAMGKLRTSIEHMRGGATLVNSLDFKTRHDEYLYYAGKIASQIEALNIASGNISDPMKKKPIEAFTQRMEKAQIDAKALADKGDADGAIGILEPVFKQAPFQLMSVLR